MASVHLAEDPVLRRPVALKRLRPELGAQGDWIRRFHAEATSVARLGNPHVVQVFDLGRDHEEDYLVMELVEGISLSALMGRLDGRLAPDAAAAIGCQAASGLAAAHEAAVVHRDIKPDNLLVRKDGTVKVADFGIAHLSEGISRTLTGTIMGSPLYMAPEQIDRPKGQPPTGAIDIFALGGVLFHLLAGRPPFEGDHPHAVMWKVVTEPAPGLGSLVPGIDPALGDLVDRMLGKDPLQRPSATEVSRSLRHFLSAGGVSDPVEFVRARVLPDDVRRAAPLLASPRLVGGTLPDAAPSPPPAPTAPTRRNAALLTASAAAAAIASMLVLVAYRSSRPTPAPALGQEAPAVPPAPPTPQASDPRPEDRPKTPSSPPGIEPAATTSPAESSSQPLDAPVSATNPTLLVSVRDEAPDDRNAIKPRLVFRNTGSTTIRGWTMSWDIPGDISRHPVVDAYWSPGCRPSLQARPGGLRLVVACSDLQLAPGKVHPSSDGLSLGIHYPDWKPWPGKASLGLDRTPRPLDVSVMVQP